jgi:hypothetical protein
VSCVVRFSGEMAESPVASATNDENMEMESALSNVCIR